ncbi:caspase family protein [Myxosarcina sp. GI1]|uniref:caspase family protein n=1 Tax=Myxosarcina sp. GI1 TaxID=1541065 RepID=UPI00068EB4A9|nr:caspase family protein [Myxosarcina sp. GI1]
MPIANFQMLMVDMGLDRRTFLQRAGLSLFALGVTEANISAWETFPIASSVKGYSQALAATNNRKLALLIGINQYKNERLNGCVTDIELQRELLIDRFGFNPKDIMTLSDRQATRENIETAFIEHLAQQAKADDTVIFHFSGYGGRVKMPPSERDTNLTVSETNREGLVNTLIPADAALPTKTEPAVNILLQDTLLLLAQSLDTDKLTLVLDTGFGNNDRRILRGNVRLRSKAKIAEQIGSEELAFREQLQIKLAGKGLKPSRRLPSIPGIVLAAASNNQIAAEGQWSGFSAGLFTYALTQSLWQMTPNSKIQTIIGRSAETVERVMGRQQQPIMKNDLVKPSIGYYLTDSNSVNAEGVITAVETNGNIEVKLIGIPANILDCYGSDSYLDLVSVESGGRNLLQVKSREGIIVRVKPANSDPETIEKIKEKKLVKEVIRVLPRDLGLTVALDANLQRIERVDATSALANIKAVSSVVAAGEQNADCLVGKVKSESSQPQTDSVAKTQDKDSSAFSYGLYSSGGLLIQRTAGNANEAVKSAISRLSSQFDNILAAKWLELTVNDFSSNLKVASTLELVKNNKTSSLQRATGEFSDNRKQAERELLLSTETSASIPVLAKGSHIRFCLTNECEVPLYALLIGIDSDRNVFALYTPQETDNAETTAVQNLVISPQSQLLVPESEDSWKWKVTISAGIAEVYAIFSTQPFKRTLEALAAQPNLKLDREQVLNVPNPLEVIHAMLKDLHEASSVSEELLGSNTNVYALDVDNWATLSFVYEVVTDYSTV